MASGKHSRVRWLTIFCVVCTLIPAGAFRFSGSYRDWEFAARDRLAVFGRKAAPNPEVVFLAIDTPSFTLDTLFEGELNASPALPLMKGGYPYPRTVYPYIIERLAQAGAKVIAFDIMFPSEKDLDGPFKEALEKYSDKVIVGGNLELADLNHRSSAQGRNPTYTPPSLSLLPPNRGTESRAGFVNFFPDDDLVVRTALHRTTDEELKSIPPSGDAAAYYSLAARMLEKAGYAHLLLRSNETAMFRYSEWRPYSLYQIFVPGVWERPPFNSGAFFKNKIVLIGPDGNWSKDELLTPFGLMLGPRIHLSALNAALNQDYLYELPWWGNLLLILAGGLIAWLLIWFVPSPFRRFLLLIGVGLVAYGLVRWSYNAFGFFPIILSPMLAFVSSAGGFAVVEQVLDRRDRAHFRKTLEQYVSRDVVKELLDNRESFLNSLVGERKQITVLFSDIRGFTTLTESSDAQQLVLQLNEYFNEMVRIVFANVGTLDKFIGDAVMSHWGGITTSGVQTDARRAVTSALQMRQALKKLNADWKRRGMIELKIGIGINHGAAIVGNLGCEVKKEVTAIGDAVNVASRLEGATKEFHLDLLIGQETAALVRDAFILRSVGEIQVKGKGTPVEVFTVLEDRSSGVAAPDWLAGFERGIRLYRQREFAQALELFAQAVEAAPEDWLNQEYVSRCQRLILEPPGADWDGVYVMAKK